MKNLYRASPIVSWAMTLFLTLAAFYAIDHLVMAAQGLPLGWDLRPAQ